MGFSLMDAKNQITTQDIFQAGKELYMDGAVNDMKVTSFWKTENLVTGNVDDKAGKMRARFTISKDEILGYGCICAEFFRNRKACRHIVALAYNYENSQKNTGTGVVYTSQSVRDIVNSYMDKSNIFSRENMVDNVTDIAFVPEITVTKLGNMQVIKASFYVKKGSNKYIIKSIYDFVKRMNENEYYEYGRRLGFVHSKFAFAQNYRELADFIVTKINYERRYSNISGRESGIIINNREIVLFNNSIDDFMEILHKNNIPVIMDGYKAVKVISEKLPVSVSVDKKGTNGYRIKLRGIEKVIAGAKRIYAISSNGIYVCSEAFSDDMSSFLTNICTFENNNALDISAKDMPTFYNMVMRVVEKYAVVDYNHMDTTEFEPWKLKMTFKADITSGDKLILKTVGTYEDIPFDINSGRIASSNVIRDYYLECSIKNVLYKYFGSITDGEYETEDYDKIYEFVANGIHELNSYGEIELSDRLKEFNLQPSFSIDASIGVSGGLLKLDIDMGDYTRNELEEVLHAYKEKQSFVRLKGKGLLKMENSELGYLSDFLDDLGYTVMDILGKSVYVPRYRSMYIDKSIKSFSDITYRRDETFKNIVKAIKNAGEKEYEIPDVFKGVLRGYQENGYYWLKSLDECGFGGILADDMGLGKTIQVIALLESERLGRIAGKDFSEKMTSIIVSPSSLIYNWESEIKRFAPDIKVVSVVGGKSERREIINSSNEYDVIITSYELLKRDIELYDGKVFRFHIIDEAQYIKNALTGNAGVVKKINSETRFALTGTPIENRLSELWSIFDFVLPGSLFTYNKFKKSFETPIAAGNVNAAERLKEMTKPFIMRRMKSDVLKELPEKQEYQVFAKMEGEQSKLYLANALKLKREIEVSDDYQFNNNKIQVLAQLTRLRQICCDPSLCYEDYEDESVKLQMCIDLLKNGIEGGHKILLFSQFVSMLEIIKKRLEEEGIKYYILTGSTKKESRAHMVENFNTDDTPVFLISLKAGGTGLNLTAADMVIHYDPWWNKAAELQATDRAHRIGQKNTVSVFKLITKGSIEEYIVDLQNRKQKLSANIIDTEGIGLSSLTKEDILRLLD